MTSPEISQLESLSEIDDLTSRVRRWTDLPTTWLPQKRAQSLLHRVLDRIATLRVRLESPLVVATFGGTGTGKSSLVNALVGHEVATPGRQRPTTTTPTLIAHPLTDLDPLDLPLSDLKVIRRDSDLLRDILIIDCPDPDTSDSATPGSNLARLQSILPHCDVLLYVSTQQKYRSSRVVEELAQAASGCRLVFVQTHADVDQDIRHDWARHLAHLYEVPDMFFVDSPRGLTEQLEGRHPSGELARLIRFLQEQLATSQRARIRRVNVLELLHESLLRCRELISEKWPQVQALESALSHQKDTAAAHFASSIRSELLSSRHLWERRLLSAVTESWGFSPFSWVLRIYNGLGTLIASSTLYRARTPAQMALIGAIQGARWVGQKSREQKAQSRLRKVSALSLPDDSLQQSQLVVDGYLRAASFESSPTAPLTDALRNQASRVEQEFLDDATQHVDSVISSLAAKNSGLLIRASYELLFLAFIGYVLYRAGRNFFYDTLVSPNTAFVPTDFYVSAAVFFLIWSGILVMLFTRRLRNGLSLRITQLSQTLAGRRLTRGLFPQLEDACRHAATAKSELDSLADQVQNLRNHFAAPSGLGGRTQPPELSSATPLLK